MVNIINGKLYRVGSKSIDRTIFNEIKSKKFIISAITPFLLTIIILKNNYISIIFIFIILISILYISINYYKIVRGFFD